MPPGAVAPPGVVHGPAAVKPLQTADSWIAAVRLPEWKAATKTVVPSVASARGVSEKKSRIRTGVPPKLDPRFVASHTQTSERGTPSEVISGLPEPGTEIAVRCWPR